jgi:hypothetical protein
MKTIDTLIIFWIFATGSYLLAQVATAKDGVIVFTNMLTQEETLRIASLLNYGMPEEDAAWVLATNKLYSTLTVGAGTGRSAYYSLSNGCSLVLDYSLNQTNNGSLAGNGRLEKAFIQSNGVNIIPITLTNVLLVPPAM